jgi:hypothetical protein
LVVSGGLTFDGCYFIEQHLARNQSTPHVIFRRCFFSADAPPLFPGCIVTLAKLGHRELPSVSFLHTRYCLSQIEKPESASHAFLIVLVVVIALLGILSAAYYMGGSRLRYDVREALRYLMYGMCSVVGLLFIIALGWAGIIVLVVIVVLACIAYWYRGAFGQEYAGRIDELVENARTAWHSWTAKDNLVVEAEGGEEEERQAILALVRPPVDAQAVAPLPPPAGNQVVEFSDG